MDPFDNQEDEEEEEVERTEEEQKKLEKVKQIELQAVQAKALTKQKARTELMGELLRSKGFFWLATSNDVIGWWQQAGNVLRIHPVNPWMCLVPEMWEDSADAKAEVMKDMKKPDGEEWEYKDRRQEIVFIGE